jgi:hypothetical protein
MNTPSHNTPFVEQDCTFTHDGHSYTSGGAVVTDTHLIGYPDTESSGNLKDWHGNVIGTCRVLSSRERWSRFTPVTRMFSYECFVNGVRYVGRGSGKGMILRAKRSTRQRS